MKNREIEKKNGSLIKKTTTISLDYSESNRIRGIMSRKKLIIFLYPASGG